MTRTLTLRRERLTDLSTDDLTAVVGGQGPTYGCPPAYTWTCLTAPRVCLLSEAACA